LIVVTGYMTVDPDQRDAALDAIRTCVAATREEEGNIDYRYSADIDEPNRFNLVEQWESEEAMNVHMGSPALATFLETFGPMIAGPVEVTRHDVSGSSKLF
jgi:quinol monooxygenase YgiN